MSATASTLLVLGTFVCLVGGACWLLHIVLWVFEQRKPQERAWWAAISHAVLGFILFMVARGLA